MKAACPSTDFPKPLQRAPHQSPTRRLCRGLCYGPAGLKRIRNGSARREAAGSSGERFPERESAKAGRHCAAWRDVRHFPDFCRATKGLARWIFLEEKPTERFRLTRYRSEKCSSVRQLRAGHSPLECFCGQSFGKTFGSPLRNLISRRAPEVYSSAPPCPVPNAGSRGNRGLTEP